MLKFISAGNCGGQKNKLVHKDFQQFIRKQAHCWLLKPINLWKIPSQEIPKLPIPGTWEGMSKLNAVFFPWIFATVTNKTWIIPLWVGWPIYIFWESPQKQTNKKKLTLSFLVLQRIKLMHFLELLIYF